jgi:hypothetical protein
MGYGTRVCALTVVEADDAARVADLHDWGLQRVQFAGCHGCHAGSWCAAAGAVEACSALNPVPGRMECLGGIGQPLVAVDYAHTPDALAQAISGTAPVGGCSVVGACGVSLDAVVTVTQSKRP